MVAAPLFQKLLDYFKTAPTRLGGLDDLDLITEAGRMFVKVRSRLCALPCHQAANPPC